ncbi:hypothetical protein ACE2PP_001615 [Salmonella enterica]|nr:hypothetical protein [Salmonella enterica]EKP2109853.1 hypothetical protein [Salmonella enterica]
MTNEEKVLFLFTQTCSVISTQHDTPHEQMAAMRARTLGIGGFLEREFDSVYAVLEKKLAEKLSD